MTSPDNTLFLERLMVTRSSQVVYDEKFHKGVNIIRGRNSSGKSTISDFIFYVLGGDTPEWSPEAAHCDKVYAQILIGGRVFVLSRYVEDKSKQPLDIYEGDLSQGLRDEANWLRFPYSRSANSESFSQVLFGYLRFPEQKTEESQNITMHQVLRLMYCDQITSVLKIFRAESFDKQDIRRAIGELLLGIDDFELLSLKIRLRELGSAFEKLQGQLSVLFSFLGKTDPNLVYLDYEKEIQRLFEERAAIEAGIERLNEDRSQADNNRARNEAKNIERELIKCKTELSNLEESRRVFIFDIEDSEEFLAGTHRRLEALENSLGLAVALGQLAVEFCPVCLERINDEPSSDHCNLCKTPFDDEKHRAGHLRMREELSFQLKESKLLQVKRTQTLRDIESEINELSDKVTVLESKYHEHVKSGSPLEAEVKNGYKEIGYIDRAIEDARKKEKFAGEIREKLERKAKINEEISLLQDKVAVLGVSREKRVQKIKFEIAELVLSLLTEDLDYEEEFSRAEEFEFDFASDSLKVNGRSKFSASSNTYLKNSFIFSMFLLSLRDLGARWPRFVLLDNIEDKGMEPQRSANFQKLIVNYSERATIEHQVIFTTSMISDELDNSKYCVGPYYTAERKTLNLNP